MVSVHRHPLRRTLTTHTGLEPMLHVRFPKAEARIRRLVDAVDLWSTDEALRRQAVAH